MNFNKVRPFLIAYRRWIAAGMVAMAISLLLGATRTSGTYQVVIASRNIEAGSKIGLSDIQLVPINFLWDQAVVDTKTLVGKNATRSISAKEPISQSDVSTKKIFDPQNPSAVAITLPTDSGTTDLVVGSRVDVYASTQNGRAKRVVNNALVLTQRTQRNLMDMNSTISLAVRIEQVPEIAAYDNTVRFTFATLSSR